MLLEANVLAAMLLFVFWRGWPGWGMVIFWAILYPPARLLGHAMAVRSRHDTHTEGN